MAAVTMEGCFIVIANVGRSPLENQTTDKPEELKY